jgi:hypothetical protein
MGLTLTGSNKRKRACSKSMGYWGNKKGRGEFAPTFSHRFSHQCQYIRGQSRKTNPAIANTLVEHSPTKPMEDIWALIVLISSSRRLECKPLRSCAF